MRWILVAALACVSSRAYADDVAIGAAVGAGGQGDAGYGALELRLDGEWRGVRIGLGGRAVWEGGAFRTREWSRPVDAISIVRQLEAHAGPVAIAAGALAPSTIGHVADGYRASLDDRARAGARIAIVTRGLDQRSRERAGRGGDARGGDGGDARGGDARGGDARGGDARGGDARGGDARGGAADAAFDLEASAEIDDVLDPALVGGALAWQVVAAWGLRAATAVDPATARLAIEVGAARRWERDDSRVEIGASIVGERWLSGSLDSPQGQGTSRIGLGAVGFTSVAIDRGGVRWTIAADLRAGNGTNGAAFGPLYRAERTTILDDGSSGSSAGGSGVASRAILDDARAGIGAGLSGSVTGDRGWLAIGGRYRPGLGALGTITAGAPMGERLQAGAWIAASPRVAAGAAEIRAVWATHVYSSIQLARMYLESDSTSTSDPTSTMTDALGSRVPAWSATIWFGASTR